MDPAILLDAMARDKKSRDGRVPFVLAPEIGRFTIVDEVSTDDVKGAIADIVAA
jgi:3-dehydroquinate synthetase